jgi:hypothetical protein
VDAREKTHFSSAPKPTFPLLGGADLPEWAWIVFAVVFGVLLTVDLIVHRAGRRESRRRAVVWSVTWVATGIGFWGFVWAISDANTANEYLAVYAIEKSSEPRQSFCLPDGIPGSTNPSKTPTNGPLMGNFWRSRFSSYSHLRGIPRG